MVSISLELKCGIEMIELGGNITLVGFKELDYGEFVVVKKLVGNYARKFSERDNMQGLTVTLKPIHKTEDVPSKFELKSKLEIDGSFYNADVVDFNLFVGLDKVLKKLSEQVFD
ncbi:MAG: hypothetical protein ACQESC_02125 [Nanobdellota archaeon]